jgi:hypothetical protein
MKTEFTDDLELGEEERRVLEGIVEDTAERFDEIIEFADIETVNIGGPTEYSERNGRPMRGPGNSPPLWKHNPFEEGELQIYVQDPVHIPHEVAHQIENIYETIEQTAKEEEIDFTSSDSATEEAFSEALAYLNQLQYFDLPEAYDVEFDNLERFRENKTEWEEYEENPRNHPDLHHAAGYQVALTLDNYDIEPDQFLANSEKYNRVVEDAVAAAWISGRTEGAIDREQYNQVVERSMEEHALEN